MSEEIIDFGTRIQVFQARVSGLIFLEYEKNGSDEADFTVLVKQLTIQCVPLSSTPLYFIPMR